MESEQSLQVLRSMLQVLLAVYDPKKTPLLSMENTFNTFLELFFTSNNNKKTSRNVFSVCFIKQSCSYIHKSVLVPSAIPCVRGRSTLCLNMSISVKVH